MKKSKLTKGVITETEAKELAPEYVAWVKASRSKPMAKNYWDAYDKMNAKFERLKRGQAVITCNDGQYVKCKVSSMKPGFDGEDEVRVGNGEYTWRVDGADYAYPI